MKSTFKIHDLGEIIPNLLEIKDKTGIPMMFHQQIELGDEARIPEDETSMDV